MARISAFADEIDADPAVQIATLEANGIRYVELRGAWGTSVMKLTQDQCRRLKRMFDDHGLAVSCIGSPIGKVRIDEDYARHFEDFKHAVDLAEFFGAGYVRIFSYYPPQGGNIADYREEVHRRLAEKAAYVADRNVTLALENETHIYGDTAERCGELWSALAGRKVVGTFDPANFVSVEGANIYERCWLPLKQYVGYFHIKDKKAGADGPCVPAGEGDGDVERILADAARDGFDGFLALEPHLSQAGQFAGHTGPELFKVAADALKRICERVGLTLS